MKFLISSLRVDGPLRTHWDVLLRLVGEFAVTADGERLYAEVEFPVLELCDQLAVWLDAVDRNGPGFRYQSLESDIPFLFGFQNAGEHVWRLEMPGGALSDAVVSTRTIRNETKRVALAAWSVLPDARAARKLLSDGGRKHLLAVLESAHGGDGA